MPFLKEYHRFIKIIVAGFDCSVSNLTLNLLYPSLVLIVLYLFFFKIQYYPEGVQNFCEFIYENLYSFVFNQVGPKAEWAVHPLMALMMFIVLLNLSNLFPWAYGATSQFIVNLTLAIIVFCLVVIMGVNHYGLNIFKHFIMDVPLFMKPFLFVLELFSFLIRPFVLAIRLTVNVFVGHLILHIFSSLSFGFTGDKFLTLAFSIGFSIFEVLVSFLQAYIFVMLACIYVAEISAGH